tara:strand:- start:10993 stop:11634 length:642 start_codon:yes stop_codon:yes gene_type:complete
MGWTPLRDVTRAVYGYDIKTGKMDSSGEDAASKAENMAKKLIEKVKAKAKAKFDKINDRELAIKSLVDNRQEVINPYASMTNEMANLGVATQAAEFQAEESDIALANTLDTMAASGAGAGGATALAQAALRSKRGISQSLQSQEAANQKAAAQGAQDLAKMQAEGEKFAFSITENREQMEIDRASKELDNDKQRMADLQTARDNAAIAEAAAN